MNTRLTVEEIPTVGAQPTHLIESTLEDIQILQYRVGLDAWCSYAEADAVDARLMGRLQQWRGSSLQQGFPIAKQLAGWDFSTRVTP